MTETNIGYTATSGKLGGLKEGMSPVSFRAPNGDVYSHADATTSRQNTAPRMNATTTSASMTNIMSMRMTVQ